MTKRFLYQEQNGNGERVKINDKLCIQCGICYNSCEHHGLNEVVQNKKVYYIQNTNCTSCRECLIACPAQAITDK
jgi:NAD-dependent dihydropyrimidine dehydrogenase PreA subunit